MNGWPPWDRAAKPGELARYVQTGVLAKLMPAGTVLPGRSGAPAEIRLRQLYEAFAASGVRYADEPFTSTPDGQDVRTPDQVLVRPRHANCLDLCVAFAAGCLDAGLHPIVVVLDPAGGGPASHVIVVVWLRGDWAGPDGRRAGREPYPLAAPVLVEQPPWPGTGLRARWDGTGEFVAVDGARAARDWTADLDGAAAGPAGFEDAVAAAGAMLAGAGRAWDVGVDIGLGYDPERVYDLLGWPEIEPLEPPYHPPATLHGPLAHLRARNEVVPFEARDALDSLLAWCLEPDVPDPLGGGGALPRVAIVHGTGGAGKTRLVAELAKHLAEEEHWYTGFLRAELLDPAPEAAGPEADLAWLGRVVSPVLLVVDYVEAADTAALKRLFAALAGRRGRTAVVLTARTIGDWWPQLTNALDRSGLRFTEYPPQELAARHPRHEAVYRRAYRRFAPRTGASSDQPPPLPMTSQRWTTLDVVMLAWLAANTTADLPTSRTALYEEVLDRELANWNDALKTRFAREAPVEALRLAAAGVSLLAPPAGTFTATLSAMGLREQTSLAPGELAEVLRLFLRDTGDGTLAVRPDPIADHLITTVCGADEQFFLRCLDLAAPRESQPAAEAGRSVLVIDPLRMVANLTRAADSNPVVAERLAALTLSRHEDLWPQALAVPLTQGGPFVRPLEVLADRDDTPLPLGYLAEAIPFGHGALRTLALTAATRSRPAPPSPDADEQTLAREAEALNNLANRQSDTGDRNSALTSIQEAVTTYRRLAETNPAAFLPDLATLLNNLSVQQSKTGDRNGALASIQQAVATYRQLAQANPTAFLPNLATLLNNLSLRQSDTGDRDGALTSIQQAVATYRQLAQTNPTAFLPNLATLLNDLSLRQSDTGDRDGALTSIQEAVTIRRQLAQANPAAFLPKLANSLNTLSMWQSDNGDRAAALTSIQEAVIIRRRLAQANPAAFLPDLANSLNALAVCQSSTGDRAAALTSIHEAVATYRQLAQANAAFLPNFAMSLSNLAACQNNTGDRARALTSIHEAVTTYRRLAETHPAAFLPNLATSLNILAVCQSDTGDRDGALTSIHEAVTTYRRLAEAHPAAFLPDLAMSLNNLSLRQRDTGDRAGALTSIHEAVTTYRRLAEAHPAAFLPNLATSLNNLSLRQSDTGDRDRALTSIHEAVAIRRRLAQVNPAAFLPDLTMSLNNLAGCQNDAGDRSGALTSIQEAVTTYRRLAQANPAAFLPDLAMSLNNLAVCQSGTSDRDGALTSIQEAVTTYRQLAEVNPAAFLPDLANSLNNLSVYQNDTGDRSGALTSIQEAVTTYRQLAQTNPAAFRPDLATSLNNLSGCQSQTGDRDGALASIQEAVTTYRQLAQTNPAAFLPDLANSLNNLSGCQSQTGDRSGALTSIQEAVTTYRQLAQTNPAAFLPNLANSLNDLAVYQNDTGNRASALAAWEEAWENLPSGTQSELILARCRWRATTQDAAGALDDLLRAAQAADAETDDLRFAARARRQVRVTAGQLAGILPSHLVEELPPWVTRPIPDSLVDLLNTWLSAPAWADRERMLTGRFDELNTPGSRAAIDALAALHADNAGLHFLRQIIADIDTRGAEPVLAPIRATDAHATLVRDWIAAPTWSASQRFLAEHPELLADPLTAEMLKSMRGDPAAEQHLAIIRLAGDVPLPEIFDAVLDPTDARDLLLKIAESGDADLIRCLWFAAPHLAQDPFAGPFAAALVTALTGDEPDEEASATAQALIEQAARNATARDRRDALARLRRLATNRPDRAATVNELVRTLAELPPPAAAARDDDVPQA